KDAKAKKAAAKELPFPPELPDSKQVVTVRSDDLLKPAGTLREGVTVAKTAPAIDFAFFPGQTYPGKPWSAWGDSTVVDSQYYAAVREHTAPQGNAFGFEYGLDKQNFRQLVGLRKLLQVPDGHYSPGKIHSRLGLGDDGWLYFSTHRGSTTVTTDKYHFEGD